MCQAQFKTISSGLKPSDAHHDPTIRQCYFHFTDAERQEVLLQGCRAGKHQG